MILPNFFRRVFKASPFARAVIFCGALLGFSAFPADCQMQSGASQKLSAVSYEGFEAYRLSDGRSEAIVVPALGRVMRYGMVGGANLLWNSVPGPAKAGEWRNWGGDKSWPAPQNRWTASIGRTWPPHPSWDGEPHSARVLPGNRLQTTSNLWPRYDCRVVREFRFDPNGDFVIAQTYRKESGPPVELALWSIAQVASPQAIFTSANPQSTYKRGFHVWGQPKNAAEMTLVRPDLLRIVPNGGGGSKIGLDAPLASLVIIKDGLAWNQKTLRPSGEYPDGAEQSGFPIEIYDSGGTGSSHYMEAELLSPLRVFYAKTSWTHSVRWSLHPLQNRQIDSPAFTAEIAELIGSS